MIIAKAITIISMIVWLFPLIKQYKTEYFYFFVVLALADPLNLSILLISKVTLQFTGPFIILMMIGSLHPKKLTWFPFAFILLLILIWFVRESNNALLLIATIGHVIVFMMITSRLIDRLNKRLLLSGFLVLLSIYELITVLKILVVVTDLLHGITQFYIASFFQILFGLLFSFISVKSSRFDFKLVKD